MTLTAIGAVGIPPFRPTDFDHGDVHPATGRVFVAHTAGDSVEVIDGERAVHIQTIPGCRESSGVLCAHDGTMVFAAARGAGEVLVIDPESLAVLRRIPTGPRPNGLAWDRRRRQLLVADVGDLTARLVDAQSGPIGEPVSLAGRPRWCVHDPVADRFLVNIREPACVALLSSEPLALAGCWPVTATGPHGLDVDPGRGLAFVACDGGAVCIHDLRSGDEVGRVAIAGAPDATWCNVERQLLYVTIGDPGVVVVIDTAAMAPREQVVTERGAKTTAFDPVRQQLVVFMPRASTANFYRER